MGEALRSHAEIGGGSEAGEGESIAKLASAFTVTRSAIQRACSLTRKTGPTLGSASIRQPHS